MEFRGISWNFVGFRAVSWEFGGAPAFASFFSWKPLSLPRFALFFSWDFVGFRGKGFPMHGCALERNCSKTLNNWSFVFFRLVFEVLVCTLHVLWWKAEFRQLSHFRA